MTDYGLATEKKINEIVEACERHGKRSIIALAGVPATGKSFIAAIAAQRFSGEPTRVREVQFHQSFTYEEYVEGLRIGSGGGVEALPGIFLEWNEIAGEDENLRYVLLIEELTRANVSAVLGELLTYVEHRDRYFFTLYSRRAVRVAPNLTIVATFNPSDRSAIDLDDALLRRLRIIDMPPDVSQMRDMLAAKGLSANVLSALSNVFEECRTTFPSEFEAMMPFGHGAFADVQSEADLHSLWHERLRRMLYRPLLDPHPFAETIERAFPWREKSYRVPSE